MRRTLHIEKRSMGPTTELLSGTESALSPLTRFDLNLHLNCAYLNLINRLLHHLEMPNMQMQH
jgi:hypothetical protein